MFCLNTVYSPLQVLTFVGSKHCPRINSTASTPVCLVAEHSWWQVVANCIDYSWMEILVKCKSQSVLMTSQVWKDSLFSSLIRYSSQLVHMTVKV